MSVEVVTVAVIGTGGMTVNIGFGVGLWTLASEAKRMQSALPLRKCCVQGLSSVWWSK